jgi:seryl-tRNA synthetase
MDYKCEYCGKVCKSQRGLEIHQEFCKLNPNKITNVNEEITNVKEEITIVNEEITNVKEEITNVTLDDRIKSFFNGLGGRTTACRYDIELMFQMYRELYPQSKVGMVWDCTGCVSHVFNRLKERYQKIK